MVNFSIRLNTDRIQNITNFMTEDRSVFLSYESAVKYPAYATKTGEL